MNVESLQREGRKDGREEQLTFKPVATAKAVRLCPFCEHFGLSVWPDYHGLGLLKLMLARNC